MVSREELQVKLNALLEQREQLSAEIAGMYSRIRRLKKANKTGAPVVDAPMQDRLKQAFPGTPSAPQSGSPEWRTTKTREELAELRRLGLID